jgi:hypothetical protein
VASPLNSHRNGAVGFIDWLDGVLPRKTRFNDLQCAPGDIVANLDAEACATTHDVLPPVAYLNQADALGRERYLKSGAGRRFLKAQLRHYLSEKPLS